MKEVKDFEAQLLHMQSQLNDKRDNHEGMTAEQVYAERLDAMSLTEGQVADGPTVVRALLTRCLLWVEIIIEKCVPPPLPKFLHPN